MPDQTTPTPDPEATRSGHRLIGVIHRVSHRDMAGTAHTRCGRAYPAGTAHFTPRGPAARAEYQKSPCPECEFITRVNRELDRDMTEADQ
ncbi:hypothetical protein CVA01_28890 [Corynebacterium variabile]|uniref:Uncharacterized protein n=1 Tax=Corynebacterium variabile TaxID=1727 RepID=A0A4Y4C3G5_9CORY|nr:hypothetical protein CVA01_28890 [Corynebacterium variabile]